MSMSPVIQKPVQIDICVCTYHRPKLAETLRSLMAVSVPQGVELRIVVADNDETPSARSVVSKFDDEPINITYIHAPKQNISVARNACLDAATGDWIAWIDDDETADRDWIVNLYATAMAERLDVVFGPAVAQYPDDAPEHLVQGDFHSNHPVRRNGVVQTGHSCNALLKRRNAGIDGLRFDESLGRTGGEDTDYFFRVWKSGANMGISETALVYEKVSSGRLSEKWIVRCSYNAGHSHARQIQTTSVGIKTVIPAGIALSKVAYCGALTLLTSPSKTKRLEWFQRGVMHLGVVAGLANINAKVRY